MPKMSLRAALAASCLSVVSVVSVSASAQSLQTDKMIVKEQRRAAAVFSGPSPAESKAELKRTPGGAAVVTQEQFSSRYALNYRDMLADVPGVVAQQRFAEEVRLSMRGSGLSRGFHMRGIRLMQDGVPFNLADGSVDFQELDPTALSHIEVYKGANALRFGATQLGGTINNITPTGKTAAFENEVRVEGGSFNTERLSASVARDLGVMDVYSHVTGTLVDGYRNQSSTRSKRFSGNVGYNGERFSNRSYLALTDTDQELPGTLTLRTALDAPRTASAASIVGNQARDIKSVRVANSSTLDDVFGGTLNGSVYAYWKDLYHPIFQVIDQNNYERGASLVWRGLDERLTLGSNVQHGFTKARQFVNVSGNRGAQTANSGQHSTNWEGFGEFRQPIGEQFTAIAGVQGLRASRDLDNRLVPANSAEKSFYAVSPKIGAIYQINDDAQIFANISRAAEPPTFSELVQAPLAQFVPIEEQKSWTYEVGSRGAWQKLGQPFIEWDVSVYHARLWDEMLQFNVNPGLGIPASTFNADKTIHQGIEAGISFAVSDRLKINQNYTLNDFKFDGDVVYGDNDIPGVPKHILRTSVTWQANEKLSLNPYLDAVPEGAVVDYVNVTKSPAYATLGVSGTYVIKDGVSFFVDARNVTDQRTITNFSTAVAANAASALYYPGEPRSVFIGLKAGF